MQDNDETQNQTNVSDETKNSIQPEVPEEPSLRPELQISDQGAMKSEIVETFKPDSSSAEVSVFTSNIVAGGDSSRHPASRKLPIIISIVAAVLIAGGGFAIYLLTSEKNGNGAASSSCSQPLKTELTNSSALNAYESFVEALKTKSQSCVDRLSTSSFRQMQSAKYGASNGDWLKKNDDLSKQSGIKSGTDFFRDLPATLNNDKFTYDEYVSANYLDEENSGFESNNSSEGITAKYKLKEGNYDQYLKLSFVVEGGSILVDEIQVVPAQIEDM